MMERFSNIFNYFYDEIIKIPNLYKRPDDENSTRYNGIRVLINYIKAIADGVKNLKYELEKLSKNIFEKELAYESEKGAMDMCEKDHKNYKDALTKLKTNKENYFESINKAIEIYLASKLKGKDK